MKVLRRLGIFAFPLLPLNALKFTARCAASSATSEIKSTDSSSIMCPHCRKKLSSAQVLEAHIASRHSNEVTPLQNICMSAHEKEVISSIEERKELALQIAQLEAQLEATIASKQQVLGKTKKDAEEMCFASPFNTIPDSKQRPFSFEEIDKLVDGSKLYGSSFFVDICGFVGEPIERGVIGKSGVRCTQFVVDTHFFIPSMRLGDPNLRKNKFVCRCSGALANVGLKVGGFVHVTGLLGQHLTFDPISRKTFPIHIVHITPPMGFIHEISDE